ncbi:hypothetical protein [Methyloglobulus sp.]|uniref:hypothetical protein n=1 Tax=Methyloglobulus sp. TaxID=2518622 RepID=UPI00398A1402
MTLYNPNQLMQEKIKESTLGFAINNTAIDRESGKTYVIQYPSFGLAMSAPSLSVRLNRHDLSADNSIQLIKCLLIIQSLPEAAFEETADELEGIYHFYKDRQTQINLPKPPAKKIKGKLRAKQVRPAFILEP